MTIDFARIEDIQLILREDRALKLLRKEQVGLIVAFLWSAFKKQHRQTYSGRELTTRLSDFLFSVDEEKRTYTGEPRYYLENWTKEGFLRQYYEDGEEEVTFELTPATERALLWITELDKREFVGAESRLLQVFTLLRDLALGTTEDKEVRLEQLRRRRAEIDQEMEALEQGQLARLDATRIREQYFLLEETANKLQSDFRQIEANFRLLNASAREELINRQGSRGEVLDEIFHTQDAILATDQGKTFNAFWAFLMDQQRQEELEQHLQTVFELPELEAFRYESLLPRLKMALVDAGDRVNKTTDRLIEQLRRFLQSRAYLDTKRTARIIEAIEQLALKVKNDPPPDRYFTAIEGEADLQIPMDRGPFEPPEQLDLQTTDLQLGEAQQVNTSGLYTQLYIDPEVLRTQIDSLLRQREQVSLREVVEHYPLEKGLSELIGYFSIATTREPEHRAVIQADATETIVYQSAGKEFSVELPKTVFLP